MGVHHRIVLDFPGRVRLRRHRGGADGRNHPLASCWRPAVRRLQQGGAELAFEIPTITREMVVVIQGLVILFSGALVQLPRPGCRRCLR
jgi:simple sugar transport system permease protein